jgi:hypothetical protein
MAITHDASPLAVIVRWRRSIGADREAQSVVLRQLAPEAEQAACQTGSTYRFHACAGRASDASACFLS